MADATLLTILSAPVLWLLLIRALRSSAITEKSRADSIIDAVVDPVITICGNGLIERFNSAAETMFGYAADEVLGKNVKLLMPSPVREEHDGYLARYLKSGEAHAIGVHREVVAMRKDGTTFPVLLSVSEAVLGSGSRSDSSFFFTGILHDLTSRKQVEADWLRAKNAAEAANQDLLAINSAHRALWQCRSSQDVASLLADLLVEQFDAYFARVWLVDKADRCERCVLADHCAAKQECLHLMSSSGHYTAIDGSHQRVPLGAFKIGLIAQGRGKTISNDVLNDDRVHDREWAAEHGLVSFAGFPLICDGKVVGVMAMFSQEEIPHTRLETLDILAQLGAGAIQNVRQIEAITCANVAKSEFLANMSHEIRTPMTAILGYAEIVSANASDPQNVEGLETIQRNARHLLDIINDILDLSKIESGKLDVEQIECSPCQLLTDVASLMRVRASAKGLPLEIAYEGSIPCHIESDPTRLLQILINLVGNAIKFTDVGKIRVVARLLNADSNKPVMQFDVVDTGIGMTDDQMDRLFQPFVQADSTTTRKFGGTGLGLTISRRLAEMLGGGVQVQSAEGQGSTFSFTVSTGPLDGVEMVASPTEAEASGQRVSKSAAGDIRLDCRILLAEDGPDNQRLISFILKKAGAVVAVAENGQFAYDLALAARDEGNPFDVVLMDMQMPVLDGYGATRKLREAGYLGAIIALTAHAMASDRTKCIEAGCDDYATKPIDRKKLMSLIARHAAPQTPTEILEASS
jgi:PAS domain S-box-containing protein